MTSHQIYLRVRMKLTWGNRGPEFTPDAVHPPPFDLPFLFFLADHSPSLFYPHDLLITCTFLDVSPIFVVPLILSLLILSSLVTPFIYLIILISATSNYFFSCAFFIAHVSAPNSCSKVAYHLKDTFKYQVKCLLYNRLLAQETSLYVRS